MPHLSLIQIGSGKRREIIFSTSNVLIKYTETCSKKMHCLDAAIVEQLLANIWNYETAAAAQAAKVVQSIISDSFEKRRRQRLDAEQQ